jgi:predicted histidine transporter YuiF (NhaC family)
MVLSTVRFRRLFLTFSSSPASDTTLGPTSGLNADGQHDHIFDTCVPTFLHFNIPLMIVSIVVAQFI